MHSSLLHLLLKNSDFSNTDISQGSLATRLGCGWVFKYDFVTNFLLSLKVKKNWKSVNIWWSYGEEFGFLFFLTHSVVRARKELRESVQAFARFKYEDSGSTVVYPRYFHFMFLSVILVETKWVLNCLAFCTALTIRYKIAMLNVV